MAPITTSCLNAHRAPLDPFTPIGYTASGAPVWAAQGGRNGGGIDFVVDDRDDDSDPFEDDDDDDDERDDEGDEDDGEPRQRQRRPPARGRREEADDDADDWEPPTREAWERMEEATRRNNGELMKRRHAAKTLKKLGIEGDDDLDSWLIERGIDPESGSRLAGYDTDDQGGEEDGLLDEDGDPKGNRTRQQIIRDLKQAESRGTAKAESRYKPAVAMYAATAALREAGWRGDNTALGLRLLDLDKLDMDFQDGELMIFGLDDQIEQIKKDLPERFTQARRSAADSEEDERAARRGTARTARGTGAARVDGGDRGKPAAKRKGWMQTLDDRMTGKR